MGQDHDEELFLAGQTSPMIFASAMLNFGVRQLLDALVELGLGEDLEPLPHGERVTGGVDGAVDGVLERDARVVGGARADHGQRLVGGHRRYGVGVGAAEQGCRPRVGAEPL